ncbi:hypothetical protein QYE76_022688 [Lolium multiflorum]|uniref:Retrotransposon gag domain-containing protein n=1 Tax=Lolium multiflorum TaxID=4521 RepID=A0AAD8RAR9_LOLMU|nr:hypothetical protein QYE76_022688 [Lolium multiflorum]
MKKPAELLKKKDEEIDINYVRKLVASAMQQQSKADTSRRLESNPDHCLSTAQKDALRNQHRDGESRTGSTERRRQAREHPNPIPVPSDSTPIDLAKGAGTKTASLNLAGAGMKAANPSLEEAGTKNARESRRSRNDGGVTKRKAATEAGVSREERRESEGGSKILQAPSQISLATTQWRRRWRRRRRPEVPFPLKNPWQCERPDTWIEDYYNAVTFAGGTPNIACRMLQFYLIGPARVWLSDLDENSIFCWFDLKKAFENHFRGTYKRPATTSDLQACIQKRRGELLRHKLTCLVNANKLTLDEMINIASDHTAADDDAGGDLAATAMPLHEQKKNRDNGVSNNNKRKNPSEDQKGAGSDMVAMTFQRGGPGGGRGRGRCGGAGRGQQRADEITAAGSRAPQTGRIQASPEAPPRGKGGKGKNKDKEEDSSEAMDEDDASPDPKEGAAAKKSNPFGKKSAGAYHTFLETPTVRAKKSALRLLNAIVPAVPQYVKRSEKACTFDRSDHPAVIPKECYALVVSPRIDGFDFSKCLMDGGASLNIMYLETLERMNLTKEQLKHSTTEFHGVVPVVPFKSSYHVIFGRPTYHKFHARACYIYNKLKIPGPNGMITISGDYKKTRDCEEGEAAFAESVISGEELQGYRAAVDPTEMQTTKKQISEQKNSFKAAIETKKHNLTVGDSSKQVSVGANMDPK